MATAAAAAVARARRVVLGYFFAQNAVTPDLAQPYTPGRRLDQRQFDRFRESGVIREAQSGRYYVDIPTWYAQQSRRRPLLLVVLLLVLCALGLSLALALSHG